MVADGPQVQQLNLLQPAAAAAVHDTVGVVARMVLQAV